MNSLNFKPIQALNQYAFDAFQKKLKCIKIAATAASNTVAIKKLSKLLVEGARVIELVAGECFTNQYRPLITSVKAAKQFIGALDIIGRVRFWLKAPDQSQKTSIKKRVSEVFKAVVDGCKTVKYLDAVELSKLGSFAFKMGSVSAFGMERELPIFDLSLLKKVVKYVASSFEGYKGFHESEGLEAKEQKAADEVETWEGIIKDLEFMIESAPSVKDDAGIAEEVEKRQCKLVGFHTQQIYAQTQILFASSFPNEFQRKERVSQNTLQELETIDPKIERLVSQLDQDDDVDETPLREKVLKPSILEFGQLVHAVLEGIGQAMQAQPKEKTKYINLAQNAVKGISHYDKWLSETAPEQKVDAGQLEATEKFLDRNLAMQAALQKDTLDVTELQQLKKCYQANLKKWQRKQAIYGLKQTIKNGVVAESFMTIGKTSLSTLLWLTGVGGAFAALPALGMAAAGVGLWRGYKEQKLAKLKATKVEEEPFGTPRSH